MAPILCCPSSSSYHGVCCSTHPRFRLTEEGRCVRISAPEHVVTGVRRRTTGSRASSSATSAAQHACVFPRGRTATRRNAPATTTGKPNKANPSALN
ncbi:unnamed protein product [Linum tenue]|uniref:Uncharacterized protein n=1 Tax=Linum tenue TaxID=586396 RepID=A0AAV0H4I2_9ROSI|nr:unnamed protein product [Linum tenue]